MNKLFFWNCIGRIFWFLYWVPMNKELLNCCELWWNVEFVKRLTNENLFVSGCHEIQMCKWEQKKHMKERTLLRMALYSCVFDRMPGWILWICTEWQAEWIVFLSERGNLTVQANTTDECSGNVYSLWLRSVLSRQGVCVACCWQLTFVHWLDRRLGIQYDNL